MTICDKISKALLSKYPALVGGVATAAATTMSMWDHKYIDIGQQIATIGVAASVMGTIGYGITRLVSAGMGTAASELEFQLENAKNRRYLREYRKTLEK